MSQYQPNFTILAKFHNLRQKHLLQFLPNLPYHKSAKYHNTSQISQNQPIVTISAKYQHISQISQYQPNMTISAKYHNISQISQYKPNITI